MSIYLHRGTLARSPLLAVLGGLYRSRATGALFLLGSDDAVTLHFNQGELAAVESWPAPPTPVDVVEGRLIPRLLGAQGAAVFAADVTNHRTGTAPVTIPALVRRCLAALDTEPALIELAGDLQAPLAPRPGVCAPSGAVVALQSALSGSAPLRDTGLGLWRTVCEARLLGHVTEVPASEGVTLASKLGIEAPSAPAPDVPVAKAVVPPVVAPRIQESAAPNPTPGPSSSAPLPQTSAAVEGSAVSEAVGGGFGRVEALDPNELGGEAAPERSSEERAEEWFQSGLRFAKSNDLHNAVTSFREAVRLVPGKVAYLSKLAATLMNNPKWRKEAEEKLLAAEEVAPWDGKIQVLLGRLYREAGLKDRARSRYQRALEMEPMNADAKRGLKAMTDGGVPALDAGSSLKSAFARLRSAGKKDATDPKREMQPVGRGDDEVI